MNFVCSICQKGFKTRGYLEAHHRKGICHRDHQCEHCQRRFTRKHNLTRHQEICNENVCPEGAESSPEAGPEAGPKAGAETGPETGPEAGPETGPEAGAETGHDAGPGVGAETGPEWCANELHHLVNLDTGSQKILYRKKTSESQPGPLIPRGTFAMSSGNEPVKESMQELAPAMEQMFKMFQSLENKVDKLSSENTMITQHGSSELDKQKDKDGKMDPEGGNEPKIDIVCLAKGDYIKRLIELHDGDEEKAMNYIKNVGIATDFLEGDFRMIKKIYFDGKKKSQFPIRIKDYKRNKLEYLEENGEWILDIRGEIVGKRLCENIVSTLLIANTQFNEVIIKEPDEDRKELLLDLFQINKTQAHIMRLLERKTQGKLSRRVAEFINYCTEVHAETGNLDNVKKVYD